MMVLNPLLAALQLLTILPVRRSFDQRARAQALNYFPLVGAIIGALAALPLLLDAPPMLGAISVLMLWILLTGGLHLDGLGDSADALGVAHHSPQRIEQVMADPRCGSFAVIAIGLVMLAKFAALTVLLASADAWAAIIGAAILGRTSVLLLCCTTPYRRGFGHQYLQRASTIITWCIVMVGLLVGARLVGIVPVVMALGTLLLVRTIIVRVFEKTSGDMLGACIELTEMSVLLSASTAI